MRVYFHGNTPADIFITIYSSLDFMRLSSFLCTTYAKGLEEENAQERIAINFAYATSTRTKGW
jgi:hypothetical protein